MLKIGTASEMKNEPVPIFPLTIPSYYPVLREHPSSGKMAHGPFAQNDPLIARGQNGYPERRNRWHPPGVSQVQALPPVLL